MGLSNAVEQLICSGSKYQASAKRLSHAGQSETSFFLSSIYFFSPAAVPFKQKSAVWAIEVWVQVFCEGLFYQQLLKTRSTTVNSVIIGWLKGQLKNPHLPGPPWLDLPYNHFNCYINMRQMHCLFTCATCAALLPTGGVRARTSYHKRITMQLILFKPANLFSPISTKEP